MERAFTGNIPEAVAAGDRLRALIPFGDDYMIFACRKSLWRLAGDPAVPGSRFDNVSYTIGCATPDSWCYGPSGEVFLLG